MLHKSILKLPTVNNIPYNVTSDGYIDNLFNQLNITIDEALIEWNNYVKNKYTMDNTENTPPNDSESAGKAAGEFYDGAKKASDAAHKASSDAAAQKDGRGFLSKMWEKIKAFFSKIWNWIKGLFSNYSKKLDEMIQKIKSFHLENSSSFFVCKTLLEERMKTLDPKIIVETSPEELTYAGSYGQQLIYTKLLGQYTKGSAKDIGLKITQYDNFVGKIDNIMANNDSAKVRTAETNTLLSCLLGAVEGHKESNAYYKAVYQAILDLHTQILTQAKTKGVSQEETAKQFGLSCVEFIKKAQLAYNAPNSACYKAIAETIAKQLYGKKFINNLALTPTAENTAVIVVDGVGVLIPKDKTSSPTSVDNNDIKEGRILFNCAVFVYDNTNNNINVESYLFIIGSGDSNVFDHIEMHTFSGAKDKTSYQARGELIEETNKVLNNK